MNVGSLANPAQYEGLAHFLEHMLFLGTEKFPDPAEYQTFINTHGGQRNAYTAMDHTNYFFEIQPTQLEGALDRFSQFFIAPLFNADYVMREREAVEGEYRMQKKADGWRGQAARRLTYNPDHPASQFSIGNLEISQASAGKTHWVMFSRGPVKTLSLEFLPSKGRKVSLPAAGPFAITLQPVK